MRHLAAAIHPPQHIRAMNASTATLLALREFATPSCRRCHGRGATGDDLVVTLCACVRRRLSADAEASAAAPAGDALPPPWGTITRRAQQIHAAELLQALPDTWS
jgi:hypothetical protein